MKRIFFPALILFVFYALTAPSWALAAGEGSLVWVTDDTPGGNYIIGGGTTFQEDKPGMEIELYRLAAEKLGIELQLKRMPWKMCLKQLEHDQVDGVFPASFKPERMEIGVYPMKDGKVDPTRRTRNNSYYLYKLKSSPAEWDGESFHDLSGMVAAPGGWAIIEDLKKMNVSVKEVPIHANSPDLLLQNRVEGFICLETVFDGYLKRRPEKYKNIVKVKKPIWEKPYYLMLSRKFVRERPELAQKIWDTIYGIKQSDDFSAIVDKYLE